ncbi:hypothetical protein Q5P01_019278 [Channa striata]|uniref:Uncharacterized protein n=1 Tax=Channa striata TaxID=64152 RepID=A0AA88M134_CHASR|nr:hypothetical protein Q5P01_019278 [Channa striata]
MTQQSDPVLRSLLLRQIRTRIAVTLPPCDGRLSMQMVGFSRTSLNMDIIVANKHLHHDKINYFNINQQFVMSY